MPSRTSPENESAWCCLRCSERLEPNAGSFLCRACGLQYPVVQGVAILTRDPLGYLRAELAALDRARQGAMQRRRWIEREGRESGLTEASLRRHADVLDTEIERVEVFRALLGPTRDMLASITAEQYQSAARASGWGFDALFPYLLRDWTGTQ